MMKKKTYKISATVTVGSEHIHPPIIPPFLDRVSAFDGDKITAEQTQHTQAELDAWTPGDLAAFAGSSIDGLVGLRNGLDHQSNTKPKIIKPDDGPAYLRFAANTQRRCQAFFSYQHATGLPGMALVRGRPYHFGCDLRIPSSIWWNSFAKTPRAWFGLFEFHVDNTGDIDGSNLPGGALSLGVYAKPPHPPALQLRISGDDSVDSTNTKWPCGMRADRGRWRICVPLNERHLWPNADEPLRYLPLEADEWYRVYAMFALDIDRKGHTVFVIDKLDDFEIPKSTVFAEHNLTNTFAIGPNTAGERTAREPQIGVDLDTSAWMPFAGDVVVDFTHVFLDESSTKT